MPMVPAFRPAVLRCRAGFTLVESVLSLGVVAFALGAVMTLNSHLLRMVQSARETNAATLVLQERAEQMRIANWLKITDAEYVKANIFSASASSATPLQGATERLTIRDYNPDPTAATRVRMVIEKKADGTTQVLESGEGLQEERLARVDFRIVWHGQRGKERVRESSTVIANVGVSRLNLPGFTGNSGTFADFPTPLVVTATPVPTVTNPPTASPTPTPIATPTPTPTNSNGNGRGNGQGTVGNPKGKDK